MSYISQASTGSFLMNITFYAYWVSGSRPVGQYTISYDANGAMGTPPATEFVSAGSSVTIAWPGSLTAPGTTFPFGGWSTSPYGIGLWFREGALYRPTGDLTLYAQWIEAGSNSGQYTISYYANGANGIPPATQYVSPGSSFIIPWPDGLDYPGWTFTHWTSYDLYGMETWFFPGDEFHPYDNMYLYAQWELGGSNSGQYTISYDANGADGKPPVPQTVIAGSYFAPVGPGSLTYPGYTFTGWNDRPDGQGTEYSTDGWQTYPATGDLVLYAQWKQATLAEWLTWLRNNAEEGGEYKITLQSGETLNSQSLSFSGKRVSIILTSDTERTISSTTKYDTLFKISSSVTLTLGSNVTLQGLDDTQYPMVQIASGGTLVMETGSKINGSVCSSATVDVNGGTFTMNGGTISGNNTTGTSSGGGVAVNGGTFTMNGGTISNNRASYGGGVVVQTGTFTMKGGTISDNITSSFGSGVWVHSNGTFSMTGGTISNNSSSGSGYYGGGVATEGIFTMSGGIISGNSAGYGGGVAVYSGTFTKQGGGIIYGSGESDTSLSNKAISGVSGKYGHAVYVFGSPVKIRDATVDVGDALDSRIAGPSGGWVE
jgi:uncharacterized repeat protein (TIGR02543 family)